MTIVINRGKRRQTYIIPSGTVLARFPEADQAGLISDFKALLGVK